MVWYMDCGEGAYTYSAELNPLELAMMYPAGGLSDLVKWHRSALVRSWVPGANVAVVRLKFNLF